MLLQKKQRERRAGIEDTISATAANEEVGTGNRTRSNEKCAMALGYASVSLPDHTRSDPASRILIHSYGLLHGSTQLSFAADFMKSETRLGSSDGHSAVLSHSHLGHNGEQSEVTSH